MIEKVGATYIAQCDYCSTYEEYDSFADAVQGIKEEGWHTTKQYGEWFNMCPACLEKSMRKEGVENE